MSLQKTKIQPFVAQETLKEKGLVLFTPREFRRVFNTSERKTQYFLETYTKQGMFVRLKKDLYTLKDTIPTEERIANALYQPSYVSLEYALAKYGVIPEMPYTITSVTTKGTVTFNVLSREFSYQKIKRGAYTGYVPQKVNNHTIFIAEPEKALVDFLYFVSLGRRKINNRIDCSRLNKKKARTYAALYQRKTLDALIDEVWVLQTDIK